jgi:hypothetical protein
MAMCEAMESGDGGQIPKRFQRLGSPRPAPRESPDKFDTLRKAQMDCLPMAYAEKLEGHITDLRTLLGHDLWEKVQQGELRVAK